MNLKVFTAFSGYDSQCMALDRLHRHNPDFNYELVGWAEIDKYAAAGRDSNDEKHICPLQLDTIHRAITLWSNEGDTVLTPFLGIGSEVYQAVKDGRKGIGFELKESYFKEAIKNIKAAELSRNTMTLFG